MAKCKQCGKNCHNKAKTKSCRKCYYKTLKGSGNPMFGKRFAKKYYCKDCKIEINHGYERCHSCACKYIWKTSNKMKQRDISGKFNGNWQGGLNEQGYYLFTSELKEKIRNRDCNICQNPDCHCTEEENGRKLDVHHIDYNKENYNENNLITLCKICNINANANRDYWYTYFTYIMEELYVKI